MTGSFNLDPQEAIHVPSASVQVHGGTGGSTGEIFRAVRLGVNTQIVRDHLVRIAKVAMNMALPVSTRISKLNDMSRQYADGWPFKNNPELNALRVDGQPILARQAAAAADQLLSIEKARLGRASVSVGKMGNQE